ncbi:MAG: chemotaxis-specific protein-glutamate methyltransferase CheB [Deltaproteobacteria bacterium]|nr:chemotaxis-specific protein-glutamate methyltransferase CheB [Deltaproteobacteria bacterium]
MRGRVRVLVVDDSAFARKVLREVLGRSARIEVVGAARDGLEALEMIAALRPDVVTLDLAMPGLDGLGVLRMLGGPGAPRVVISTAGGESLDVVAGLQAGAVDVVHKPTALATGRLYELGDELVGKVLAAADATARPVAAVVPLEAPAPPPSPRPATDKRILVVGASTGGPSALTQLISALPADFPLPVALVLHIPVGYTEAFARRLDGASALDVVEAHEGLPLRAGLVVVARAGVHLTLRARDGHALAQLDLQPAASIHRPSVDELFLSAARAFGPAVLAVVLTGMGDDGLVGSRAIHAAGGTILTEAESSCVVYGMPRCVHDAGLAAAEAPIASMAALVLRHLA